MSFHDERMLKMMEQLPQNNESGYNAVVPIVEWEFSQTGDPIKDRRRNIKAAIKALKPVNDGLLCQVSGLYRSLVGHNGGIQTATAV